MRWNWVMLVVMTLACAGTAPQVPMPMPVPVASMAGSETRPPTVEPAEVALDPSEVTTLTVLAKDAEGRPLSGIRFKARSASADRARAQGGSTEGDGQGQVRLPSGWYVLSAEAPGYQSFVDTDVRLARQHPKTVTMTLQPGGPVSGRVVDAAGAPVAGARLAWVPEDTTAPRLTAEGAKDARFTFEGVGRGRGVLLTKREGFVHGRQVFESLPKNLTVVLTATGTLRVRVIEPNGRSQNDPSVSLERLDPRTPEQGTQVAGSGASVHEGLPPGRYRLKAWYRASDSTSWAVASEVAVQAGQTQEVTLRFKGFQERSPLRGQVVDSDGRPLAGLQLTATTEDEKQGRSSSSEALTDAQGRFVMAHLLQGPQRIKLSGSADLIKVAADTQDVSLVFRSSSVTDGFVEGRVLDPDGRPLTRRFTVNGRSFENPQGRYSVQVPASPAQALTFEAQGLAAARRHVGPLKAAQSVLPDVTLERGRTLRGQVLRVDGTPASTGFDVAVLVPREWVRFLASDMLRAKTDANGRFVVEHVPSEARDLEISRDLTLSDDAGGTVVMPLKPDQEEVTVRFVPDAVVSGTLVDAEGRPLKGFELAAHCHTRFTSMLATDAEGRFTLRAPGGQACVLMEYREGVPSSWPLPPKRAFSPRWFVTIPGEPLQVDLRVRTGPATLRVTLPREREWSGVSLVEGDVPLPATADGLNALMSKGIGADTGEADRRPEWIVQEFRPRTDSFEFSALPLGRYTLFATEYRGAGIAVQRIPVDLSTPGVHAIQSKLPEDGGTLFAR